MSTLSDNLVSLPQGGLRSLLRQLGSEEDQFGNPSATKTGRIALKEQTQDKEGAIYLNAGRIYAVTFTNFTPPIASRLYTGGYLNKEQYEYLSQFPSEEVGALALQHGYVIKDILDNINRQMILSSLTYLYSWNKALWTWEANETFHNFTIPSLETLLLLAATDERIGQWDALARNFPQVTKAHAIPCPGLDWNNRTMVDSSPEMNRLSNLTDGTTSIAKIATICGFTRFEIAARLAKAIVDGILVVDDPDSPQKGNAIENSLSQMELNEAMMAVDVAKAAVSSAERHLRDIQTRLS